MGDSEVPEGWDFLDDDSTAPDEPPLQERRWFTPLTWVVLAVVAVLVVVTVAVTLTRSRDGSASTAEPRRTDAPASPTAPASTTAADPSPSPQPSPTPGSLPTALTTLASLDVKGRAPQTGYDRLAFGPAWADVDNNGCETRDDILVRDLTRISYRPTDRCVVDSGLLADPYSGRLIRFTRGWETSMAVQIDHVVALSNSWQTGSQYWRPGKRLRFANDPLNLLAVDGELNQQKGDGDTATWLPPNKKYRCAYVARQIAVKARYGLWVTRPEKDAMTRVLSSCPSQPLTAAG